MDAILERRSVRKFDLTKKISRVDLKKLCYYAEQAPTARNQRSRSYVIIDDEEVIKKLSTVSNGAKVLEGANSCIAIIGTDPSLLSTPLMQSADLAAATENLLLAATNLEYGSCWLGMYPMEDRMELSKSILNLDSAEFVYSIVALGYPSDENCFYNKDKMPVISYNRR